MILLAIDTCEARGSVAVRREGNVASCLTHSDTVDYSEWLLPAVDQALKAANVGMTQVEVLAVATGPGSFTGLRVGLTTAKAWAEVYGMRVVGVSRLEAMTRPWVCHTPFLAAFYDAQRGQVFGALYNNQSGQLARVGDELVIPPEGFVALVAEQAGAQKVGWVSQDLALVEGLHLWKQRVADGDAVHACGPQLATAIALVAEERAARGMFSDPLELDANYVRRSDAEIFWKGSSSGVR